MLYLRKNILVVLASGVILITALVHNSTKIGYSSVLETSQLYDIPNFVYQRTQMHFPQAEESWLNQAAEGKIGDDVKPQHILNKLNDIISDARTHALTENYEARVKAKKLAIEDNYATYDVQKGKVVHKIYGKQIGGSVTLKGSTPATLSSPTVQELSQLPAKADSSLPNKMPYAVEVPQGLRVGQKFVAKVPPFGKMLVTVPVGARGGEVVAIEVPMPAAKKIASKSKPRAITVTHLGSEHPNAANMLDSALQAHTREAHAISAGTQKSLQRHSHPNVRRASEASHHASSEHPTAASMLDEAIATHYATSAAISSHGIGQNAAEGKGYGKARGVLAAHANSAHPVAAGMLDAALDSHYSDTPHNVFGLEH